MTTELLIHALGPKGDGIHHSDRGPIYVDRALPGDTVEVKIQNSAGGVLRGDLIRVVTASPQRVTAPCPNYDVCGGCTMQHASDEFYRNWKIEIVRDALDKKNLKPERWLEPVFLPAGHRRRATFAGLKKGKAVTLGYFQRRTHNVTDIAACLVADPAIMALRGKLVTLLAPLLQDGKTTDVFIQNLNTQTEIVLTGPIGTKGKRDLAMHEAIAHMAQTANICRVSWRTREHDAPEVMLEMSPMRAKFGALDVALPPLAFLQPTKAGEDALVNAVLEALPTTGTFADLFSGCGTFSGPMLERGPVDAYENATSAIGALDKAKGGKPLKALQRDLFRKPLQPDELRRYSAVVFDPPRAGAQEQAKMLASSSVPRLVGVSCSPATFARDARILVDGGYVFESIKVVDQFAWSHHVELVAAFTKRT